jgi:hypothetical protein
VIQILASCPPNPVALLFGRPYSPLLVFMTLVVSVP